MFVVILDNKRVESFETRAEAIRAYDSHLAQGHPAARVASVYEGPDEETVRRVVLDRWEPVRLVCAGIPRNFYGSEDWRKQQDAARKSRLDSGGWDCICGEENDEDVRYCPSCGSDAYAARDLIGADHG